MALSTPPAIQAFSSENRTYTCNFSNFAEIVAGDTLSSVVSVTADPADGIIHVGTGTISAGANVNFTITGGAAGTTYLINCIATTAAGATLLVQGTLVIVST